MEGKMIENKLRRKRKVIIAIGIILILIVTLIAMNWRILFTNDYHPSPVDASPLVRLTSEQIDNLESALMEFEDFDFIFDFRETKHTNHHSHSSSISMSWSCTDRPGNLSGTSLSVSVGFFSYEETAIESFRRYQVREREWNPGFVHIVNANNTEVVLRDAYMDRAGHLAPTPFRLLITHMRLGNARITLIESPHVRHLDRNISSDFILLLVELLERYE